VHGTWPQGHLDHRDGNPSNNAIANLRPAAHAHNNRVRHVHKNNAVGLKGVTKQRVSKTGGIGYETRISVDGKPHYLGYFKTPEDAHAAYCAAADRHFGAFACS
jgi:hypothetical protein